MFKYKIERENTSLGIIGLNAKHPWINIGCAKNDNDIETKLLNFIKKNHYKTNIFNIHDTKIKILDRINKSEIISKLSDIHNKIAINNLFELLEKQANKNIKIDWYRGIIVSSSHPWVCNDKTYIKAISNGSHTLIIHYYIINNGRAYSKFGILTSDEIPEIAKTDFTINNYEYTTNYDFLKDKNIYNKVDSITIINNNNETYKYYQNSSMILSSNNENKLITNGNYKIELFHLWN
jgi:hypothetical protein